MAEANLTRDEARARAELISGLSYEVSLDLTTGDETFGCETTIKFDCATPGATTFVDYSGASVAAIWMNGQEIEPGRFTGTRIELIDLRDSNELRVRAHSAYQRTGVGMHRFVDPTDGNVYLYSDLEPFEAHRVFPCFDQPDLKGMFRFAVKPPAGAAVISNMPVAGQSQGAWEFETTPLVSTYITAVVAGPYHSVYDEQNGIRLGLHCRQSLAQYLDSKEWFEITKQGFDYYHEVFDYPYPFGKYDQVMVPEFNSGAMENAGCVTFNEVYIYRGRVTRATRERRAEVILHEMAHMWFGDLVTMRWWDDLWLNESFATFMAQMAQEHTGFANHWVTFANDVKVQARRQDELPTTHPIAASIPDTLSTRVMFDAISYSKGASVLRQLVAWVGEEAFFEGVRNYFRRHEYGNTELNDFLAALEQSSGRDLQAWSKEWIETAGVNVISPAFETRNGAYSSFSIVQEAPPDYPTLRSHRLGVGLYDLTARGIEPRKRVDLEIAGSSTPVPELAGQKVPDLLLLNDGDLTYAKLRFDERSLETVKERLREVRDPLARALCWSTAWDMVRDAELSAGDYLSLVTNNIVTETDITVLQDVLDKPRSTLSGIIVVLLGRVKAAIEVFGNPDKRDRAVESLAIFLEAAAENAEPGSDHQLLFARGFASSARSPEHLRTVGKLLESDVFEGLEVSPEFRWLIVRSLASAGAAEEEIISAEQQRDPTDEGNRQAARARASRPDAQAKAAAWESIVGDTSLSRPALVDLIAGVQQTGQEELLRPYAEQYFRSLPIIWDTRSIEISQAFAMYAYPHFLVDDETVAMTDEYLQSRDPAPPLRRLLLEGKDGLLRAQKGRARDAR